jgi:hypothetical protein
MSNVTMRSRTALESTLGYVLIIYRLEAGLYKEGGVGRAQGEKPDSNSNTTLTELEFGSNTTNIHDRCPEEGT